MKPRFVPALPPLLRPYDLARLLHEAVLPAAADAAAPPPSTAALLAAAPTAAARVARALLPLVYGAPATLLLGTPAAQRDADAAAAKAASDGAAVSRLTREVMASG